MPSSRSCPCSPIARSRSGCRPSPARSPTCNCASLSSGGARRDASSRGPRLQARPKRLAILNEVTDQRIENVIIVGSGPAGYTAALYTARANLEPLVIEGFAWGGLLQQTTDVENYPGFPEGIMGPPLMQQFRDQAERFGARLETDDAITVELSTDGGLHKVHSGDEVHLAKSVILAMGAQHRKLGVPGEAELSGRGVSYCATCDAAFFKGAPTLIIGGGDSAMEEAMFLSKFAASVAIVHRRDDFRASKIMLERARAIPNIEFLTPYVVEEFLPGSEGSLSTARLRHTGDVSERELEITGAFIAV